MATKVGKLSNFLLKFCFMLFIFVLHFIIVIGKDIYYNGPHKYSTKTMYNYSFYPDEFQIRDDLSSLIPNSCKLVVLDVLMRHGIRNPGKKDIVAVNEFHNKLVHLFNNFIPQSILEWRNPFVVHEEKHIAESGKIEQESIARRFAQKFINELKEVEENNIVFITTDTNRTVESCLAFQQGFQFINEELKFSLPQKCVKETKKLRFFDHCKNYNHLRKKKMLTLETNVLKKSKLFEDAMEKIKNRYGLDHNKLSSEIMKALFVVGATELAVRGDTPWLQFFTDDEINILEYFSDLRSYWKRSYGHKISYEMSCLLLKDIFDQVSLAISQKKSSPKFLFRFCHAETILPILAVLGLHKDELPLTGSTFHQNKDRYFKTSRISPFSANIAFIVFLCDSDTRTDSNDSGYMMRVLVNEIPVTLPFCDSDICPLSVIRHNLRKYTNECDYETMCASHRRDEL